MEQEELLRKIAEILDKLKITYMITGGIAVVAWGRPRFTADIDIVVELFPEKLDKLAGELLKVDKDVYADKTMMREALEKKGEFNFIHPASGLKIDFWIMKNDEFSKEALKRRIKRKIANVRIFLTSPEDLILSKLLWYKEGQSTRQLEDIESILKIQKRLDFAERLCGVAPGSLIQVTDSAYQAIADVTHASPGLALEVIKMIMPSAEQLSQNRPYTITEANIKNLGLTYEALCEHWDSTIR